MMCSAGAECDVWLRQVMCTSCMMCASRMCGTHRIIATEGSYITFAARQIPHLRPKAQPSLSSPFFFSMMCSARAERDVWLRQVMCTSCMMCASRVSGTHHITATEGSYITFAARQIPHLRPKAQPSLSSPFFFSMMCSARAERDVWLRQVMCTSCMMCASRVSGTHHITATEGRNIFFAARQNHHLRRMAQTSLSPPPLAFLSYQWYNFFRRHGHLTI